jgi:hypothetical protein
MSTHHFQTPQVVPFLSSGHEVPLSPVLLRVSTADVGRIVRALEETSINLARDPAGSRVATAYRSLAGKVRAQCGNVASAAVRSAR